MNTYRYILQKGGKKHTCPECGQKKWSLYIDTETGEVLPDEYGRCDREVNCAWMFDPYTSGYSKMITDQEKGANTSEWKPSKKAQAQKPVLIQPSFIDVDIFKKSRSEYQNNNFVSYLINFFGNDVASGLISSYHLSTTKYQFTHKDFPDYKSETGGCIFWQIDLNGKVRSGKLMLYNPQNGKRIKEPFSHIHWAHKALKIPEYNLCQCLFGEHLLKLFPDKPVAIVESEKTAIIASVYLPKFNWLAVGALTNLKFDRCAALQGKNVFLFPDLKAFDKWSNRGEELRSQMIGTNFFVSDLLEKNSTDEEKLQGLDLADHLIKYDWNKFSFPENNQKVVTPSVVASPRPAEVVQEPVTRKNGNAEPEACTLKLGFAYNQLVTTNRETENEDITEDIPDIIPPLFDLEEYRAWYATAELPTGYILLNGKIPIYNMKSFLEGRMNHVAAFTNYREPGNRSLFIRQLKYVRKYHSHK